MAKEKTDIPEVEDQAKKAKSKNWTLDKFSPYLDIKLCTKR